MFLCGSNLPPFFFREGRREAVCELGERRGGGWQLELFSLSEQAGKSEEKEREEDVPIRAYAPQEYLVPCGLDAFLLGEGDGSVAIDGGLFENAAVARNNGHEEKGASKVANVRDGPGDEEGNQAYAAVQDGSEHVLCFELAR